MTLKLRTRPGSAYGFLYWREQHPPEPPPEPEEDEPEDDESANKSVTNPFDFGGKMKINDLKKCLEKAADLQDEIAEEHTGHLRELHKAHAENFRGAAAKCDKADESDDLNKSGTVVGLAKRLTALENRVEPTQVRGVIPNRPGVTAVPRAGQPAFDSKPNVPVQFEKLVVIEE